jgi:hypothetical protein
MGERAIASIFNVKNVDRCLFWRESRGLGVVGGAIASILISKTGNDCFLDVDDSTTTSHQVDAQYLICVCVRR